MLHNLSLGRGQGKQKNPQGNNICPLLKFRSHILVCQFAPVAGPFFVAPLPNKKPTAVWEAATSADTKNLCQIDVSANFVDSSDVLPRACSNQVSQREREINLD
jgi:hypothetical protein